MSEESLYNRYRPKRFDDVIGQDSQVRILKAMLENQWLPPAIMLTGPFGTGKCVVGSTRFLSVEYGWSQIHLLHKGEEEGKTRFLDATVYGKEGWDSAEYFYYGGLKPTIKVILQNGMEICGTEDHPVYAQDERGLGWKKLKDLQSTDSLAVTGPSLEETMLDPDYYYLGFAIGDGSYNGERLMLSGSRKSLEYLLSLREFGDEIWYKDERRLDLWSVHTRMGRTFLRERFDLEDTISHEKKIPEKWLRASQSMHWSLLCGLFDTDGCVQDPSYSTMSKDLADQVQLLLIGMGVNSWVEGKRGIYQGEEHFSWRVGLDRWSVRRERIALGIQKDWSMWRTSPEPSNNRRVCYDKDQEFVGLMREWRSRLNITRAEKRLDSTFSNLRNPKTGWNQETLAWLLENPRLVKVLRKEELAKLQEYVTLALVPIASIEDGGVQEVFDLNVPKSSSFVANGILSHNTTLSRLFARAVLCDNRTGNEPCGVCESCLGIDQDNNPNYTEFDAASRGSVDDVREMKEFIGYRSGGKPKLLCYDESHMLSTTAQNAMLNTLESGNQGITFIFATTESTKMLPTVRSRCVALDLKLISAAEITERMRGILEKEKILYEERAIKVVATYVRGHVRDALVLAEQLAKLSGGNITEEMARIYLRLDKYDQVYQLLVTKDKKQMMAVLEDLLCNFAASDLTEIIGQILVNAYKNSLGFGDFTQVDAAWLKKVIEAQGDKALERAEKVLTLGTDYASINYGIAALTRILISEETGPTPYEQAGNGAPANTAAALMRKPRPTA